MSDICAIVDAFDNCLSVKELFHSSDPKSERRKPVHDQLFVDDAFLGLLGVSASKVLVLRKKQSGVEDEFHAWLQRDDITLLHFVAMLRVLNNAVLARKLADIDPRIMDLYNYFVPRDDIASQRDKVAALVSAARALCSQSKKQ